MNTCVRCGTQFAAGEDRCPFCSLPVAGDADVTRAAPDRSVWQQPGQQPGQPGQQPGQPGQQPGQPGGQQWSGQQPSGEGPWQQSGQPGPPPGGQPWQQQGGPQQGGWQGQQGMQGQPWQGQQGMQGGGWQQGPPPGGQPWQQGGGMPPKKGMHPGLLIGIAAGALLILGLVAWGLVAAFSSDDDTTTATEGEETSEPASPSASSEPTPTEESSPTESTEPSPTDGPTEQGGGGGGSDTVDFDLSSGEAVITVTVSSAGRLQLEATSDQTNDIVMVVNDPEGEEVCNEDSTIIFAEECTIQAEVGEYEVVITPYDEDLADPGTGQVRIR